MNITRRTLLRTGAQALSAASLMGALPAFAAREPGRVSAKDLRTTDVAGLAVISGAGCNVVALPGPDGALMIDGGLAVNSALLLAAVARATNTSRVATLINTHWHPEQTGSNQAVGKAGAAIIAHEVTKLTLGVRNRSAVYDGIYGPLPKESLPTKTTYNTGSLQVAGEQVDYRYLPGAHTNGDLFIHFPKRNVIVTGGVVGSDSWPVIDYLNGGFMHGFVRSYEILADVVKPDTIVIPTSGPTLTGADVVRQKDTYWALFKQFWVLFNKGGGPQDAVNYNKGIDFATVGNIVAERPLKELIEKQGDPAKFLDAAYRSMQMATIPF